MFTSLIDLSALLWSSSRQQWQEKTRSNVKVAEGFMQVTGCHELAMNGPCIMLAGGSSSSVIFRQLHGFCCMQALLNRLPV
jgi:hypothetical protein